MTPNPNRIEPTTVANAATDGRLEPVEQAKHVLPPWVTVVGVSLAAVSATVLALPTMVQGLVLPPAVTVIAAVVGAVASALGFAGPGITKKS